MAGTASPRPLRGQSFYLDLPSGRSARDLAEAIGRLGGVSAGRALSGECRGCGDTGRGLGGLTPFFLSLLVFQCSLVLLLPR